MGADPNNEDSLRPETLAPTPAFLLERPKIPRGRPRTQDWAAVIAEWETYTFSVWGETARLRHFCKELGISERTFRRHRKKRS